MSDFVGFIMEECRTKVVALSGGTFMNVKTNMKITQLEDLKELYICPSSGDESNAFGACYLGHKRYCQSKDHGKHTICKNDTGLIVA